MQSEQQELELEHPQQQPEETRQHGTTKFSASGVKGSTSAVARRQVAQSAEHSEGPICDAFGQVSSR